MSTIMSTYIQKYEIGPDGKRHYVRKFKGKPAERKLAKERTKSLPYNIVNEVYIHYLPLFDKYEIAKAKDTSSRLVREAVLRLIPRIEEEEFKHMIDVYKLDFTTISDK
jgi:hypothetical protein